MSNFIHQIDRLRRRLQRRRQLASTCWAVAILVASVLLLMAFDRALGVGDPLGRVVCTALLASVGIVIGRRWLAETLLRPVSLLEAARRIERRHPKLRDMVTSALEFSQQSSGEFYAGSDSLRRAVVLHAARDLEDVDWQQLVPRRPLRRAMSAAAVALLVVGVLFWWSPQAFGIGLTRLLNPLSPAEWPRVNDLQFVDPPQVLAVGDDLVLRLRDTRGPLPTPIKVHYRTWRNNRWYEETQTLLATGTTSEIRRPNVQESLEYRATGGDHHTMPWQRLTVVVPPRLENLQVTVHPPDYTSIPSGPLAANAQVLADSGLEVAGQADQEVSRVVLRTDRGFSLPATIDQAGRKFRIAPDGWRAEQSDLFFFELTTETGLTARTANRLALEVVRDQPPQVHFAEPANDLTVTPAAVVPLLIEVRDDLAIRDVALVYRRTDRSDGGDQLVPLYHGPKVAMAPPDDRERQIDFLWQLGPLSLEPGSVVEVRARANDYQPATGQTAYALRLSVVSLEDLLRSTAERETQLLQVLERLLRQQRELRERTAQWAEGPDWPARRWEDEGRAALSGQRQIADLLADRHSGVIRVLESILADFRRNAVHRPESIERLQTVRELLRNLVDDPLAEIQQRLSDFVRLAQQAEFQSSANFLTDQREPIAEIARRQDDAIDALERVIDRLSQENMMARFESDLAVLQVDQQQLAEKCRREMAEGLSASNAPFLRKEAFRQGATQQRQLERRLAKLLLRMSQTAEGQPSNANCLADTLALARKLGVQATMRSAAEDLAERRVGRASTLQQKASEDLQRVRKRLTCRLGEKKRDGAGPGPQGKQQSAESKPGSQPDRPGNAGTKPKESTSPTTVGSGGFSAERLATDELVRDLWGHLPQRQREQILQPLHEEFLPKYAEEIEAYFRALAEPQDSP